MFPSAKVAEEAKEIAIGVEDDELAIACFFVAPSIPALLKRDIDGCACPQRLRMKMVDVGNLDLKVHPSAERVFQGSRAKPASGAIRLFEHQVDRSAREISEQLLGTFNADTEPENVCVEAQGPREIGNVKFGNDGRGSGHAAMYQIRTRKRWRSFRLRPFAFERRRAPVAVTRAMT